VSVLKKVGYAWIPHGTTLRGRQQVPEVLEVDPSMARGEGTSPAQAQDLDVRLFILSDHLVMSGQDRPTARDLLAVLKATLAEWYAHPAEI
jgi:hypothetical protein